MFRRKIKRDCQVMRADAKRHKKLLSEYLARMDADLLRGHGLGSSLIAWASARLCTVDFANKQPLTSFLGADRSTLKFESRKGPVTPLTLDFFLRLDELDGRRPVDVMRDGPQSLDHRSAEVTEMSGSILELTLIATRPLLPCTLASSGNLGPYWRQSTLLLRQRSLHGFAFVRRRGRDKSLQPRRRPRER